MATIIDWYRNTYTNPRNEFAEILAAIREIRTTIRRFDLQLDQRSKQFNRMEAKMAEVDDAVAALTPKLEANHQEIVLVLDTYAANQAKLAEAVAALSHGATPETLAALKAASDKADADLLAMQNALATTPPVGAVDVVVDQQPEPVVFAATTSTTEG